MFAAEKIHGDDTPVPVLEPGLGRTWTGRLWVYVRDRPSPQQLRQVAFRALRRQIAEAWYRLWDLSTLFSFFIKAIPSTVRCGAIGGSEPRAAAKVLDAAGRPSFLGGNFEKPASIANAIEDAVGVRVTQIPFTPERVLAAIEAAR